MTKTLKSYLRVTLALSAVLLICMLLLCGCGEKPTPAVSDGNVPATGGDALVTDGDAWATGGDAWATDGDAWATDGNAWASGGNAYVYASDRTAEELTSVEETYATDGNAAPVNQVRVSTVTELLDAIAPDTEVILAPGTYDLSSVEPLARRYCYFRPLVWAEGHELVLTGVTNFVLRGESGKAEDVKIVCAPRMADVLSLETCSAIRLTGLTFGHTEMESPCDAGVLHFESYCSSVYISDCDIYGCGTTGITAENASALTVKNTVFHDFVYDAMSLSDSSFVLLDGCEFRSCGENSLFNLYGCSWVSVRNSVLHENTMVSLFNILNSSAVTFDCCEISNNTFQYLYNSYGSGVELNSCTFPFTSYTTNYASTYEGCTPVRVNGAELAFDA